MKAADIFSYAFSAIRLRKLRAGLTTLGVIIGIAAIVALLSLGQGFQNAITQQFEKGFATNTLVVTPRTFGMAGTVTSNPLFVSDVENISHIPDVTMVMAVIQRACYIKVNGNNPIYLEVTGVNFAEYGDIYNSTFIAEQGTIPSVSNPPNDTIVIGTRIHDPGQNGTILVGVNDNVQIIWTNFTMVNNRAVPINETYVGNVSAVLNKIGGFSFGGPSDTGIYIPISQAERFFGTYQADQIIVQLTSSDNATVTSVSNAITSYYGSEVTVTSSTAVLSIISNIFVIIEVFLGGIAGISLLVAGIGIMNIMIVSLMERTREIGILKALGMKSRTVLLIFLSESIIMGLLGGVIGIGLGWTLASVVARSGFLAGGRQTVSTNQPAFAGGGGGLAITPVLSPTLFIGALGFGLIVSIVFALYPAWRASKLKPVEALRYE
jgi:putative ABC transport system permease protein